MMIAAAEREMRQDIVDHISRFNSAQLRRVLEEARLLAHDPNAKRYGSFSEIVREIDAGRGYALTR